MHNTRVPKPVISASSHIERGDLHPLYVSDYRLQTLILLLEQLDLACQDLVALEGLAEGIERDGVR